MANSYLTSDRVVNNGVAEKMWRIIVLMSVSVYVMCFEMDEDQIQVANFDVKPGGALLSFEKEWVCEVER